MLGKFMPREENFFILFKESAEQIVLGARAFREMLEDMKHQESHSRNIKVIENKADEITHKTVALLHQTFITPMDREDIHQLITKMDDVLDFIEAASQRLFLYDVKNITQEMKDLAEVCLKSAEQIQVAVQDLENIKEPEKLIKICVEINRLENDADYILRAGVAKLFKEEQDVRELIKLKEIYELLETVTDRCEDVANIIEGIILEYA